MIRQKTIKDPVTIEGRGLQTGSKTRLIFKGSPAGSGINFIRVDLPGRPLISVKSISFDGNAVKKPHRTVIGSGRAEIQTTEHLLAAISGLGISNITVEIDGKELPGLDGSSRDYVALLDRAGLIEQDAPAEKLVINKPVWCGRRDSFLAVFPHHGLHISYFLSYPEPSIGDQFLSLEISEEIFRREIAPARTFCMKREALILLALGYGRGADYSNTLIMDKRGPVKNSLRFPDEHVRHKILDLMGDLSLAGMPLQGHIVAIKSGHSLNMELVKKLKAIA
ncbi:MAG: UDP-3-O-acyl-N-acetylglucosamine deacetylase [Candidatus Omnitrophica bacterium]|nr:UDP-3-O-acyl-N-acetylglucosamine deacetylase [Candidatus Omnitrophota bacterium]